MQWRETLVDKRIDLYLSYADEDENIRKELEKHLALLRGQGLIADWHRRKVSAGQESLHEINTHLSMAQIILLLVSPDFMMSTYCREIEVNPAMERHRAGLARVVPVILRPVSWEDAPFGNLEPLPTNGKPVSSWQKRDDALYSVAEGIRKVVEELRGAGPPALSRRSPLASNKDRQGSSATLTPLSTVAAGELPDDAIFYDNMPLRNPDEFYGRNLEKRTLLTRTRNGASTSLVGPRRIGKTWLIQYLRLIAPQPSILGSRFVVGYLDASDVQSKTIADFTRRALEVLHAPQIPLGHTEADLKPLAKLVEDMRKQHVTLVLCIDEFEAFRRHQDFHLDFLSGLRAMTQEGLVLVTASKKPLVNIVVDIVGEYARTSPFFNVFQQISLKPFSKKDAETFIKRKGIQAKFTEQECNFLLKYAKLQEGDLWPPLLLQLTGRQLLDDKNAAQDDPDKYRPLDSEYWSDFAQRVKEQYKIIVPDEKRM